MSESFLLDAGFALSRVEEPRPSDEYWSDHRGQRGWRDHAALYLYVGATRPHASADGFRRQS